MQFPNTDEEDGDFSLGAAGRSRLSSLFQGEPSGGDVNQALTYVAPKQPKKHDAAQSGAEALKLIHVAVAHAYKLENGNYVSQGKLGCAVLGNHEISNYKLLLYKGKQVHVASCSITPNFVLHVQTNNYITFYDDKKENWSLMCESEGSSFELIKQIALAKANSFGKNLTSVLVQDLAVGDGPNLGNGDSAEIKYTGWLLTNFTFGQVFDSNMKAESSFRLRLGKSKVIKGWNDGLLGAKKNSKKLLIIPPSLAYGSEGLGKVVPPNSTLIFEVYVKKVKISRDTSHSPSPVKITSDVVPDKKPEVPPRSHSISNEDSVRMRGASISEQLSQSPQKDKAQLISRMAKMGTAMLPLQGAIPAQPSSESENEEEQQVARSSPVIAEAHRSREASPKLVPRSRQNSVMQQPPQSIQPHIIQDGASGMPLHMTPHSSQVSLYAQGPVPNPPSYMTNLVQYPAYATSIGNQFPPPQQQYSVHNIPGIGSPVVSSMADTHLPLLITETRSQGTEVRLGLSKITDKVDTIIQKVDDLRSQTHASSGNLPSMEGAILAQNIERIVQENTQLKKESETKNSKIQSLNEKICDLLQRNQRFFEESNSMLEQRSDSLHASTAQSHARLLSLEQDKVRLSSELSESVSKVTELEAVLFKQNNIEKQLQEKLNSINADMESKKNLFDEIKEERENNQRLIMSLRGELENLGNEKMLLSERAQALEEKFKKLAEHKDTLEKTVSKKEEHLLKKTSDAASEVQKLKSEHEKELDLLKSKLNQSTDSSSAGRQPEMQQESEKLKRELENLQNEKEFLAAKVQELQQKLETSLETEASTKKELLALQNEMESAVSWKKEFILKYESFHEKTRALKDKYESQIADLVNEVKKLQTASSGSHSQDFTVEIKKVMNVLYKMLQGKIDPSASYSGSKVLETCLQTIRALTFQMLERNRQDLKQSSEMSSASETENSSTEDNIQPSKTISSSDEVLKDNTSDTDVKTKSNVNEDEKNYVGEEMPGEAETRSSEAHETALAKVDQFLPNSEESLSQNGMENLDKLPEEDVSSSALEVKNRDSPDNKEFSRLGSERDISEARSKVWKPQPPPLFDDDDDEEDSDEWLK